MGKNDILSSPVVQRSVSFLRGEAAECERIATEMFVAARRGAEVDGKRMVNLVDTAKRLRAAIKTLEGR